MWHSRKMRGGGEYGRTALASLLDLLLKVGYYLFNSRGVLQDVMPLWKPNL